MKLFKTTALGVAMTALSALSAHSTELTIAIVNNGHMINMQKVAEAYTAETGTTLNWVSLEEGVLREQVTSDTATGGGQYDVINIGMQEAPIWGAAGWIEALEFGADYDVDDMLPAIRNGLSHEGTLYAAPFYGESSMVMYRKDLTDAAGVSIGDIDSWDNVKAAAMAIHNPDAGVYGACLRGKPGWGDNMAFITTVVNSFGGAWFDADMRPTIDSDEWRAAINFYVDLLGNYGPPGSEGNSFNEILALYNEGKCGMWIDATIAASFLEVDGVATLNRQTLVIQWAPIGCGLGQWLFQPARQTRLKLKSLSNGPHPKTTSKLSRITLTLAGVRCQQVHVLRHMPILSSKPQQPLLAPKWPPSNPPLRKQQT
jgi:sorbitol/mannitol transport system substrate-binding protein